MIESMFLGHVQREGAALGVFNGSARSGHPIANVLEWDRPRRYWQATDRAAQTIRVNYAGPLSAIYLRRCNFAEVHLTIGPSGATSTITIPRDPLVDRRQCLHFLNAARTPEEVDRLILSIDQDEVTDDNAPPSIGVIALIGTPLVVPVRADITLDVMRPEVMSETGVGHMDVTTIAERLMRIHLPWEFLWNQDPDADYDEESLMAGLTPATGQPLVFCRDIERPERAYMVRNRGSIRISSGSGIGATMPLLYEEIG